MKPREGKMRKSPNGITLIALVITIVVLLILAGITIASLLDDNGIINRAKEAKNEIEEAQRNETEQLQNLTNSLNEMIGNNEEEVNPTVKVTLGTITTSSISVTVTISNLQSEMPVNPVYNYYIKKSTDANYSGVSYTGTETSYTFVRLIQNTSYDVKVTTQDNTGKTLEGTLTRITTRTVEGATEGLKTGNITAGTVTWNENTHKASVILSTTIDKTIQYKIGASGTWTPTSGSEETARQNVTVSNLNHNDIVYARLIDTAGNYGSEAFITILDGTAPLEADISLSATSINTGASLTATVTHTDNQSGVNTTSSKYIWNTTSGKLGTTATAWNTATAFKNNPETITLSTTKGGTYFLHVLTVDNGGNKSEAVSEAVTIATPIVTGEYIANATEKSEYYGKTVDYKVGDSTLQSALDANEIGWKIFYAGSDFSADGKNHIYLIADNYIPYDNIPKTKGNHSLTKGDHERVAYWNADALNDYTGSANITDANIKKLNNDYLNTKGYNTITNNGMKAVAYMCDTSSWIAYKGVSADYAIGGPTIEMLMKSYSQSHNVDYKAEAKNENGYYISRDGGKNYIEDASDQTNLSKTDSLYVISDDSNASGYWLSSPMGTNTPDGIGYVYWTGDVWYTYYSRSEAFRPLVCLSSDVELEKQADGNYKIKEKISDIIANATDKGEYYGKTVTNYTVGDSTLQSDLDANGIGWKIFYAGSDFSANGKNHIYLIADDCIPYDNIPETKGNHSLTQNSDYLKATYWNTDTLNDYNIGSASITDANIKKLNNSYFSKNLESTYENMKAVAYMCDTTAWGVYKGVNADYAIGGPTIEILMKSYSQLHNVDYRAKAETTQGYVISCDGGSTWSFLMQDNADYLSRTDNFYTIINEAAKGYWLASPVQADRFGYSMFSVYWNGYVCDVETSDTTKRFPSASLSFI